MLTPQQRAALDELNRASQALVEAMEHRASDAEIDLLLAVYERAGMRAGVLHGGEA